eukprot:CAMPEP_0194309988 /NCGR_PEP_ID=MMETSP0171-20130528/6947_1 /TAXON_ID=218684 /ORGANISM="Corethron pennatum, Strain L29A3" /LENGTH=64 /DNA_ID=CAMNT_0039063397 /DNA_START=233 /DNA_END=424 /DNA_ORIENTATION=-
MPAPVHAHTDRVRIPSASSSFRPMYPASYSSIPSSSRSDLKTNSRGDLRPPRNGHLPADDAVPA